jgi:hypothetical protein
MIGQILSIEQIKKSAHVAASQGGSERACLYPVDTHAHEVWLQAFRQHASEISGGVPA